jgi:hypothetical protein
MGGLINKKNYRVGFEGREKIGKKKMPLHFFKLDSVKLSPAYEQRM